MSNVKLYCGRFSYIQGYPYFGYEENSKSRYYKQIRGKGSSMSQTTKTFWFQERKHASRLLFRSIMITQATQKYTYLCYNKINSCKYRDILTDYYTIFHDAIYLHTLMQNVIFVTLFLRYWLSHSTDFSHLFQATVCQLPARPRQAEPCRIIRFYDVPSRK